MKAIPQYKLKGVSQVFIIFKQCSCVCIYISFGMYMLSIDLNTYDLLVSIFERIHAFNTDRTSFWYASCGLSIAGSRPLILKLQEL